MYVNYFFKIKTSYEKLNKGYRDKTERNNNEAVGQNKKDETASMNKTQVHINKDGEEFIPDDKYTSGIKRIRELDNKLAQKELELRAIRANQLSNKIKNNDTNESIEELREKLYLTECNQSKGLNSSVSSALSINEKSETKIANERPKPQLNKPGSSLMGQRPKLGPLRAPGQGNTNSNANSNNNQSSQSILNAYAQHL